MSHVRADRVMELTTTTGTGTITVAGAVTGFGTLAARLSVSDTFEYTIFAVDGSGVPTGEWETGIGTYTASNQFSRSVRQSSNSDALVNFSAGTKYVAVTLIATELTRIATGAWQTLFSWNHSTDGDLAQQLVDDITANEILVIFDKVILSTAPPAAAAISPAILLSADNGSTFFDSSGAYIYPNTNNIEATDSYLRGSVATSTAARSGHVRLINAQQSGVPKFADTNGDECYMPTITSAINAIRLQGRSTPAVTFISGKIWVLGR